MKDEIIKELTLKKILILGFGREGKSTYEFIKKNNINCELGIADANDICDIQTLPENVKIYTGAKYLESMKEYDVIFKTPRNFF